MNKLFFTAILVTVALALAGLGHYYLLYQPVYIWDVVLFYTVAILLAAWAYRRGVERLLAAILTVANALAALAALLVPPPAGLVVVLLFLIGGSALALSILLSPSTLASVDQLVVSLRQSRPVALVLLLCCLVFAVVGQVYFTQDYKPMRTETGPHFWTGVAFYAISAVCLLILAWVMRAPVGVPVLATSSSPRRYSLLKQPWRVGMLCGALALAAVLVWDLRHRSADTSHALPFALWIWMMAAYLAAFLLLPSWRHMLDWWHAHRFEVLAVVVVMMFAFSLRAYSVDSIPYSVGGDEATQGVGAIEFLEGRRTNMFAISDWFFYPNFGYFSLSFSLRLFGRTVAGLRMLAVLVGTVSVLLTYLLTRRLLGRRAALMVACFLAAQHYHIHFSRLGSINIFDTLFTPLFLYLLVRGLREQQPGWFAAAGLTMGVGQYCYNGAKMLPFVLAVLGGYLLLVRRDFLRANLVNLGVLALGAVLAFIPVALHEMAHPGSFTGRVSQVSIFQSGWLEREVVLSGKSIPRILGEVFLQASLAFNYFTDRSFWYRASIPYLDSISGVLFILGLILAMRYAFRSMGYLLVTAWFWLAVVLGGALTYDPPLSERLITTAPVAVMLVTLGLTQLVEYGRALAARLAPMWRILPALVVLVLIVTNAWYYFVDYTPTHVYGNPTAEVMTRLLKELALRDDDFEVYFFGAPYIFYETTWSEFLTPEAEGMDVQAGWVGDLSFVEVHGNAVFIFLPERLAELETVRMQYPIGVERPVYSSADGRLLYVMYEVPPLGLEL
jgi:hypothetical protein